MKQVQVVEFGLPACLFVAFSEFGIEFGLASNGVGRTICEFGGGSEAAAEFESGDDLFLYGFVLEFSGCLLFWHGSVVGVECVWSCFR